MLKKTAAIVIAIVVIVSCCCIPVSAATINAGTATQVYVGNTNAGPVINGNQNADGSYWINYYAGRTDWCLGLLYPVDILIDRGDIVSWSSFYVSFYISLSSTMTDSVCLGFMDENYKFYKLEEEYFYSTTAYGSFGEQFDGGQLQFNEDVNVKYICIMLYGYYGQSSAGTFGWQPYTFKLSNTDKNSIMLEGVISEQQKTNEKLDDLNSNQEETNEKLDDLLAQPEQEKNEANSSGNDGVGELTGVIPDYSTGFITGMNKLATSLSYNGTECKWTFPQLYIPAMEGVTSEIPLTDGEWEIDIGSWVQKLPPTILKIIQIVLTVALILYCVKELYDTVQYALTLKSGGAA